MTSTSAPSASSVRTVSMSDSPLVTELLAAATLTTSAPSRLAAASNETRVRVDGLVEEDRDPHALERCAARAPVARG